MTNEQWSEIKTNPAAPPLGGRRARVVPYAPRLRAPVLPAGWAPLSTDHEAAVLAACDAATDPPVMRLGSVHDAGLEYRVYRLPAEKWCGLTVVCRAVVQGVNTAANQQLLGLARDTRHAVTIALDFYNRELADQGLDWRLDLGA